jgi:hypothetical protein
VLLTRWASCFSLQDWLCALLRHKLLDEYLRRVGVTMPCLIRLVDLAVGVGDSVGDSALCQRLLSDKPVREVSSFGLSRIL